MRDCVEGKERRLGMTTYLWMYQQVFVTLNVQSGKWMDSVKMANVVYFRLNEGQQRVIRRALSV